MALAYAVVLVQATLFDRDREDAVREAQRAADRKFELIAQEAMKALVTRDPEPRMMTVPELKQGFPTVDPLQYVGLYFTADIS